MITAALARRAEQLGAEGAAFVTATVVHVQRPASVEPGNVALVLADGTIEGFVGGMCSEHSVRAYALQALESGNAVLLRILPFSEDGEGSPSDQVAAEDGAVVVQNPCLSGGVIEVFLEPVLPAPRVLVVGETPTAAAILLIGAQLGLDAVSVKEDGLDLRPGDLALVVAAHGRDELHTLRRGLEAGLPYIGLVASPKRGTGVLAELRGDGVSESDIARIDVPAGIDIGARTPAEIALSILARIVAVRRDERTVAAVQTRSAVVAGADASQPAPLAIDPICGMTVAAVAGTLSLTYDGETTYFCCEGCKSKFEAQREHAGA
jgi:xanthine dehydrogenase accessory factor